MKDKLTRLVSLTKGLFTHKVSHLTLATVSLMICNQPSQAAEQEWWFDVEVILFEWILDTNEVSEKFKQSSLSPASKNTLDIFSSYLTPDTSYLLAGLPYCRESKRAELKKRHTLGFSFPQMDWVQTISSKVDALTQPVLDTLSVEATDNFEYQHVSTDIFEEDKTQDTTNLEQENDFAITSQKIPEISYIEWQIPNSLPCVYSEQVEPTLTLTFVDDTSQPEALINQIPIKINGVEWQDKRRAFLLPEENLRMTSLFESIKSQRDINPILHISWRQEVVFGRENSQAIRLFAGKNYGEHYNLKGNIQPTDTDDLFASLNESKQTPYIPEEELAKLSSFEELSSTEAQVTTTDTESSPDLFSAIDAALLDDTPLAFTLSTTKSAPLSTREKEQRVSFSDIWKIDGEMAVYLRNIGRVPYLHIDSNLNYRQPVFDAEQASLSHAPQHVAEQFAIPNNVVQQPNFLQSVNFDQLRRVISKEVHYFDHPLFGMIVTINRYKWPVVEKPEE